MLRTYTDADYDKLKALYEHTEWYGGVFDEARDGREPQEPRTHADTRILRPDQRRTRQAL